ncbi:16S rRNA (cytosine(1402)-N(4))-methyltransferase RsmH [Dehalococcoides mccartyi]|uniref:16S rRNA (cytosine(1402)-N(4))-methyltransferase RsmH n=1 Tax=Dehalococcoides mccartyi TaxID=61435 RepID=UPI0003C88796|nr:16S rRNA (cytosine(1402)-N(4))-methyltransferase RsmH [Dehalococcoides mccartyi]AHB13052.1 ribosomal RNA small subunit methyltransferase H [Dehalococcoides mccartyi GY50]AII57496.1 16S rRNA methyltransferase [Dehalococcoides mccartyi CG1]APH11991.1 ribosomal RNA small subunit methyltransferase H [Dehalococcoides mccartyi]
MTEYPHIPVMLEESIQGLGVIPGGRYVDCTLGAGGHSEAILEHSYPGGQLLSIDTDPKAIALAAERLKGFGSSVLLVNDNFANLKDICQRYEYMPVHGILFDLGLSSMQLDREESGFSFQTEAPLDMRFSPGQELSAADIVNTYDLAELSDLIWKYGEEPFSRRIARAILEKRPFKTTTELASVIEKAVGGRHGRIHPATRTFQALRIAVNEELSHLESALAQAQSLLGHGGRLVVISYHSLEDRIVKQYFQKEAKGCICPDDIPQCVCDHQPSLRIINRRVITPSDEEISRNPRSRSAKMRVAERIIEPGDGRFFSSRADELVNHVSETGSVRHGQAKHKGVVQRGGS